MSDDAARQALVTALICIHCGQPFEQHIAQGDRQVCRDNTGRSFDYEFQVNPEVIDFVEANLDKSGKELAELWIERVRARKP